MCDKVQPLCYKFLIGGLTGRKTAPAPPRAGLHPPCRMVPSRQQALELSRPYVSLTRSHTLCLHLMPNPNQKSDRGLRCRARPSWLVPPTSCPSQGQPKPLVLLQPDFNHSGPGPGQTMRPSSPSRGRPQPVLSASNFVCCRGIHQEGAVSSTTMPAIIRDSTRQGLSQ